MFLTRYNSHIIFRWFEFHKKLILLNQQSVLEINALREESTKEWFVSFKKVNKIYLNKTYNNFVH